MWWLRMVDTDDEDVDEPCPPNEEWMVEVPRLSIHSNGDCDDVAVAVAAGPGGGTRCIGLGCLYTTLLQAISSGLPKRLPFGGRKEVGARWSVDCIGRVYLSDSRGADRRRESERIREIERDWKLTRDKEVARERERECGDLDLDCEYECDREWECE